MSDFDPFLNEAVSIAYRMSEAEAIRRHLEALAGSMPPSDARDLWEALADYCVRQCDAVADDAES